MVSGSLFLLCTVHGEGNMLIDYPVISYPFLNNWILVGVTQYPLMVKLLTGNLYNW